MTLGYLEFSHTFGERNHAHTCVCCRHGPPRPDAGAGARTRFFLNRATLGFFWTGCADAGLTGCGQHARPRPKTHAVLWTVDKDSDKEPLWNSSDKNRCETVQTRTIVKQFIKLFQLQNGFENRSKPNPFNFYIKPRILFKKTQNKN